MSFVTRPCRNCWLDAPATRKRPMWETSNRPAAWRTAKCSSRMDVHCGGFGGDRGVHLGADLAFGERGEVRALALSKGVHGLEETQRSFQDKVRNGKAQLSASFRQPDHHGEVCRHKAILACAVTEAG